VHAFCGQRIDSVLTSKQWRVGRGSTSLECYGGCPLSIMVSGFKIKVEVVARPVMSTPFPMVHLSVCHSTESMMLCVHQDIGSLPNVPGPWP
jgi:hypothetical protein